MFRAAQPVIVGVGVDVFAVQAAWQVDVLHGHVAWVNLVSLSWVRTGSTASAEIARTITAIARIISPMGVLEQASYLPVILKPVGAAGELAYVAVSVWFVLGVATVCVAVPLSDHETKL